MEQNDKIRLLLDMHEHPENYTDELPSGNALNTSISRPHVTAAGSRSPR